MKSLTPVLMWCMALVLISCASREEGWLKDDSDLKMSTAEVANLKKQSLASWKQRHVKDELLKALDGFEKLSRATNDKYEYYTLLSRGYYFLADTHFDDLDQKMKHWEIGTSYGEKAMATNAEFAAAIKKGESVSDAIKYLKKEQVSAVYWSAVNLGKWAKEEGITTILKYKSQIKNMIQFVEANDANYFAGAPLRYWGAYYAVAPSFAGGDVGKSEKYFNKVIGKYPNYLASSVLYAQFTLTKQANQKKFKEVLSKVVNTKLKMDDYYPENFMEVKKAKKLLETQDDLF